MLRGSFIISAFIHLAVGLISVLRRSMFIMVENYFVRFKAASLDFAFLVGLYLLIRKILFQMAKRKSTFTNKM